jgi:hypothetical protein
MKTTNCSCGCSAPHIIFSRRTADNVLVQGWSDGYLTTTIIGQVVARSLPTNLLWILADEIGLYEKADLRSRVKGARKALDKHVREPHRTRLSDLPRLVRAYAPAVVS